MKLSTSALKAGARVWYENQRHVVLSISSQVAHLRAIRTGEHLSCGIADLLTSQGFAAEDPTSKDGKPVDGSPEATRGLLPGMLSKEHEAKALELQGHLLEAMTGYWSGTAEDAQTNEPKKEYDPEFTSISARIESKAGELKITGRMLWKYKDRFERQGLYGLADKRALKLNAGGPSSVIARAIDRVVVRLTDSSNLTQKRVVAILTNEIRNTSDLPDSFEMPSDETLRRFLLARSDGRALFASAKRRRNANNRPKHGYTRFHATRPGEVVLIDATPLDTFVLDERTYVPYPVKLTIALDLYTRSLVGWRFTRQESGVDAALLLADIISPKRTRENFGPALSKPFVGIPASIVTRLQEDEEEVERLGRLVPIPFLHPESLLIDQGRVFLSDTFLGAAAHLGINVMLARPYTPTDKAQVERMFRTIRENFVECVPGYKGPNVEARGKKPEDEAFYFLHELDELFREWVATYWQVRTHSGLFLHATPTLELTPNQMLEEGIARAGYMSVLPDRNMYYQLLPVVQRKIHHYGVDTDLLRYDSPVLDPFRERPSPYPTCSGDKWPFRYDPRDRSQLYFYDRDENVWHPIPWIGTTSVNRPFDDKILQVAKRVVIERKGEPGSRTDVEDVLNELLNRMADVPAKSRAERKRLAETVKRDLRERDRVERERIRDGDSDQTGPTEPDAASGAWSVPAIPRPANFQEIADDEDPDETAPKRRSSSTAAGKAKTPRSDIKPVDEAFEDDSDDLAF